MIRTLQVLTVLVLISAGAVFVLCAVQWRQRASGSERIERNLGPLQYSQLRVRRSCRTLRQACRIPAGIVAPFS